MTSLEHLVGRQFDLCELKRRLHSEYPRPPPVRVTSTGYGPCLLVSRECASGGTRLARLIGERIGWRVFDREIVDEVAHSANVRRQWIASVDERVRHGWSEFWRKLAEGEGVGRETYLHHLREVILLLGQQGEVIILGRGANYILPAERAVSVRLRAPLEVRVRRFAERERVSMERARRLVEQTDAERAAFIREAFGRDVDSTEDYDLVLNMDELGVEAAAEAVLAKLQERLGVQPESVPCER
ncbi:MAG: cytidylate kinase-like family protein [Verrucomicrobia bacterium]|jgi:cytidylate kinase|nr:cytidylate kinase-like family protein [Verrucomicrobiota bacterium]OQC68099.1 MAG: cytidylate kinase [Verrucomicrobia bacterium ADurb.Bin006]MDI9379473.1 cytidylate kinase-like family protein [Verrucomicrobiota bacterium]NMD19344.1 cytidylate kinase-like family protein [Verrucomicrobiota bacterium]HOA62594.1 cytidylate kinase-like family protein [Verrucomicrobiota bacterium]